MTSATGRPDWTSSEAYLEDLASFVGARTGLSAELVDRSERLENVYTAACYRGFGGPILNGMEDVDFDALAAKYPEIIPKQGYFVHTSHEDRIVFLASELGLSRAVVVDVLSALIAFRIAAGISMPSDEDEASFRRWARAWLKKNPDRHLQLIKSE